MSTSESHGPPRRLGERIGSFVVLALPGLLIAAVLWLLPVSWRGFDDPSRWPARWAWPLTVLLFLPKGVLGACLIASPVVLARRSRRSHVELLGAIAVATARYRAAF